MKMKSQQALDSHLAQQLAPIYVISGNEPLLVQEATDAVRKTARDRGCTERSIWDVASGFDWSTWLQAGQNQSLFAERQLIELRLPSGKPGSVGEKALLAYAQQAAVDENVLLMVTGKLESAAQRSKWLKALENVGVWLQVWPLARNQLPGWILKRMQAKGMQPTPQAITLLVERVEGNPLACKQEIEKLFLLRGPGPVDDKAVEAAVVDNARFDVYGLVDAALQGNATRVSRILLRLQQEGVEPVLVLWALSREIRTLAQMGAALKRTRQIDKVMAEYNVWSSRKPLIKKALERDGERHWWRLMRQAARTDRVIKGELRGNCWDELLKLGLATAGVLFLPGGRPCS